MDCRELRSIEEIVAALRARAAQVPRGQWVLGHSYDDTLLAEMHHPTRHDLDRASFEHPILLTHISCHNVAVNSRALTLAGIGAGTPDPPDGAIDRDALGEPTGVLWEWAQDLVRSHLPACTADDVARHLREGARDGEDQLDRMAALGVAASFFVAQVWHWGDRHRDVFLGPARAGRPAPDAPAGKGMMPTAAAPAFRVSPPSGSRGRRPPPSCALLGQCPRACMRGHGMRVRDLVNPRA